MCEGLEVEGAGEIRNDIKFLGDYFSLLPFPSPRYLGIKNLTVGREESEESLILEII